MATLRGIEARSSRSLQVFSESRKSTFTEDELRSCNLHVRYIGDSTGSTDHVPHSKELWLSKIARRSLEFGSRSRKVGSFWKFDLSTYGSLAPRTIESSRASTKRQFARRQSQSNFLKQRVSGYGRTEIARFARQRYHEYRGRNIQRLWKSRGALLGRQQSYCRASGLVERTESNQGPFPRW